MVARKRTKTDEIPAAETIIEAGAGNRWAGVAAGMTGAYLSVWLIAALCLSVISVALAGWPYLQKALHPEPLTPWAADIATVQAGFDYQIAALETRIAALDSQLVQFAENSETASADRTEQAAILAQIASQLDALETQLAELAQPPAAMQPSDNKAGSAGSGQKEAETADIAEKAETAETDDTAPSALSGIGDFFSQIPDQLMDGLSGLGDMFSSVITVTPLSPDDEKEAGK